MEGEKTKVDGVTASPTSPANATTTQSTTPAVTSPVTDERRAFGAEKRIRGLVGQVKAIRSERDALLQEKTDLENAVKSPGTSPSGVDDDGLKTLDEVKRLREEVNDLKEGFSFDKQVGDFKKSHPELDDDDIGIIMSVVDASGLVDEKTGLIDFNSAHKSYANILQKKTAGNTPKPDGGVLGGGPGGSGKGAGKPLWQMTEAEQNAEWDKRMAGKF